MKISPILSLTGSDVKARFAGSVFGVLWAFLSPMLTIAIYWFVYTIAIKGPEIDGVPYLVWLIAGILPWFFFSDGLSGATTCYRDYQFLVQKTGFGASVLPTVRVISALWVHLPLLLLGYGGFFLAGIPVQAGQFWIFFWLLLAFFLLVNLGGILALWHARIKDVGFALQAVLQLGFWVTPVFWNPADLPDGLQTLCLWNPAAILVSGYREALLYGQAPNPKSATVLIGFLLFVFVVKKYGNKKILPTLADRL